MSETDFPHLSVAMRKVPQMKVNPMERALRNAYDVWAPSSQTQRLASEANRTVFAELVTFRGDKKCRPFASAPAVPKVIPRIPETLVDTAMNVLVRNFNGGPEPTSLSGRQKDDFGSMLSTDLHLLQTIDLQNETYWRRVVLCYSVDLLSYYEHDLNPNTAWKRRGVELKLAQLIERQDPRYWEIEALEETVKRAAQYVEHLSVEQLMPFPTVPPLEDYEAYELHNAPDALCNHGSLDILGHLENLTTLSLVFGVKNWTEPYRSRYSRFSDADVMNLGVALRKLVKLKSFTLFRSRFDREKLTTLVESLVDLSLVALSLRYCHLGKGCGAVLGRFLSRFGPTLKWLDLSGNRLDAPELDHFCPGLAVYRGVVDRLNLSYNPIGAAGVLILGGAIRGGPQLRELNFTGCPIGAEGSFLIIQLMSFHTPLRQVHLNCVPISPEGYRKLVLVLRENKRIDDVQIRECGLSAQALAKVRQILNTNARLRMNYQWPVVAKPLVDDANAKRRVRSLASYYEIRMSAFPNPATV